MTQEQVHASPRAADCSHKPSFHFPQRACKTFQWQSCHENFLLGREGTRAQANFSSTTKACKENI